uniref:Uncharacterized protein n=1 Tax=Arundo donax TaxID=35708 RepID=A0A0A9D9T3_ARUDO
MIQASCWRVHRDQGVTIMQLKIMLYSQSMGALNSICYLNCLRLLQGRLNFNLFHPFTQ